MFLDLKNVFGTINHSISIAKLEKLALEDLRKHG